MNFAATLEHLIRTQPQQCPGPIEATVVLMASPGLWQDGQWFPRALLALGDWEPARDSATLAIQLVSGQVPSDAPFLEFPNDIQPDWAQGLIGFQEWLLGRMHAVYGPSALLDENSAWPRAARRLCQAIGDAHACLADISSPPDQVTAAERLGLRPR